jgi:hypothetical protein
MGGSDPSMPAASNDPGSVPVLGETPMSIPDLGAGPMSIPVLGQNPPPSDTMGTADPGNRSRRPGRSRRSRLYAGPQRSRRDRRERSSGNGRSRSGRCGGHPVDAGERHAGEYPGRRRVARS